MTRFAAPPAQGQAGVVTAAAQRVLRRWLAPPLRWLFRPQAVGWHRLPQHGPYLLVANHSAGLGLAELASLAVLWAEQPGPMRPLAGFAHVLGFRVAPIRWLHGHLGSVPSTREAALAALQAGVPLLVFPGGDHETLRPVWQYKRVDFAGRVGFLRLARAAQVPVVPLGISRGALTAPMLLRARWLAAALVLPRLLGLQRYGISLLGLLGALGLVAWLWPSAWLWPALWLWLTSPLTFLPWIPASLRFEVGQPLLPQELFAGPEDEAQLQRALHKVQAAVQALVQ